MSGRRCEPSVNTRRKLHRGKSPEGRDVCVRGRSRLHRRIDRDPQSRRFSPSSLVLAHRKKKNARFISRARARASVIVETCPSGHSRIRALEIFFTDSCIMFPLSHLGASRGLPGLEAPRGTWGSHAPFSRAQICINTRETFFYSSSYSSSFFFFFCSFYIFTDRRERPGIRIGRYEVRGKSSVQLRVCSLSFIAPGDSNNSLGWLK